MVDTVLSTGSSGRGDDRVTTAGARNLHRGTKTETIKPSPLNPSLRPSHRPLHPDSEHANARKRLDQTPASPIIQTRATLIPPTTHEVCDTMTTSQEIESILHEERVFPPPVDFSAHAHIGSMEQYRQLVREAEEDEEGFWAARAEDLHWFKKWDRVLEWQPPFAKWFVGGRINAAYNCLDRHLDGARRTKPAIIWEGEPGDTRTLTYEDLHREVCQFANVLKSL